jgi:hypothetical protein
LVLKNVGYLEEFDRRNFDEFKINYLQNGWFRDGQNDHVDYYNAWGISYDIYRIHLFDPFFGHEFVKRVLTDSGALTAHLVVSRLFRTFGLAERRPALAYAVMAPLIC